jgi:protein TonB
METKKNPEVKLDNYRTLFFEIGLIISLFAVYLILESRSSPVSSIDLTSTRTVYIDEIMVPQTERKNNKMVIPKLPPPPVTQIIVVANDSDIEFELDIETTEIDEDYKIEFKKYEPSPVVEVEEEEEEEVYNFQIVESQPVFPGCENFTNKQSRYMCFQKEIMNHVKKNFKYPESAREMGVQGRVIVKFVIAKDGYIKDVSILRGIDKTLDKEAMRIVNKLPRMTPAEQRGRPVPVSFMLPITFRLQ